MAGVDVKKTNGEEDGSRADAHPVSAVPASDDVDGESSAPAPQQHGAADAAEGGGDPAEAPADGAEEEEEEEEAPKGERFPPPRPPTPPPCDENQQAKRRQESFFGCFQPSGQPAASDGNRNSPGKSP